MDNYKKLVRDLLEEEIEYRKQYDPKLSTKDILDSYENEGFQDLFGNMTGSRTCNTWQAQQFIDKSGAVWDEEILDLFDQLGDTYFVDTLKRGAETLDVVICELVADQVLAEMQEETK